MKRLIDILDEEREEIIDPPSLFTELDLKKIEIDYLSATGMANGSIIIFFDPTNTHTGSLKNVSFYNGFNNLKFEFWRGSLGPLTYNLTRLE